MYLTKLPVVLSILFFAIPHVLSSTYLTITWSRVYVGQALAGAYPCTGRIMTPIVLRVGLRVGPCFSQPTAFSRSHTVATRALAISKRNVVNVASAPHFSARTAVLRHTQRSLPLVLTATVIAGSALGISSLASPSTLHCDGKCIIWMVHSPES